MKKGASLLQESKRFAFPFVCVALMPCLLVLTGSYGSSGSIKRSKVAITLPLRSVFTAAIEQTLSCILFGVSTSKKVSSMISAQSSSECGDDA